ncbi:PDT-domain-containing protein [Clavulina sp. PMI_390]|nr:PDT-domain-containing protein [Clavulina sp. PMI_390]
MAPIVAYLGPAGTYTHQAAVDAFSGQNIELFPATSIEEVFKSVSGGAAAYGVVPIENSSFGTVIETYDALRDQAVGSDTFISKEVTLIIKHCLLARPGVSLSTIRTVYSHPQALGQCADWLEKNLPGAVKNPVSSTAAAVDVVLASDAPAAAIGSAMCAEINPNINIVERNIQDFDDNQTRFIVISHQKPPAIVAQSLQLQPRVVLTDAYASLVGAPPPNSLTGACRALLRFIPTWTMSSAAHTSMHLDILSSANIPLGAVVKLDRRPSMWFRTWQDMVFFELDLTMLGQTTEEVDQALDKLLDRAKLKGDAAWLGKW